MPNFTKIEETFLWTDGHFETDFIRSTLKSRPDDGLEVRRENNQNRSALCTTVVYNDAHTHM